ncbi:MAG: sulfatase [Kiritimatiellales bacterium]
MKRRRTVNCVAAAAVFPILGNISGAPSAPKNVLLLCVDDLRPVLGCYGGAAKTPNLDRLAKEAAVFTRHYIQWPVCGPSRASMLSGLRPDTTGIYEIRDSAQIAKKPDAWPTLPLWFKQHGYTSLSFGKIYHDHGTGEGYGWSEPAWHPSGHWTCYMDHVPEKQGKLGPAYEIYKKPESVHNDFQIADQVIEALKKHRRDRFFIAGGFLKPHLPFVAAQKYWDLYSEQDIRRIDPTALPKGAADFMYNWCELPAYSDPEGNFYSVERQPDEQDALTLIHAYYACVSATDAQIGRVLDALDDLGLSDSTAVVIWGDHGFHLGDHTRWAKHTQFEQVMRSPLMVRIPGHQNVTGPTDALVESVDIYPSLCDFAGLPVPEDVEGKSFLPVLDGSSTGKQAAFSQIHPVGAQQHLMAYSIRTKDFRYVEWRDGNKQNQLVWTELYDHRTDPEESISVAGRPEYKDVIQRHAALIKENYRSLKFR